MAANALVSRARSSFDHSRAAARREREVLVFGYVGGGLQARGAIERAQACDEVVARAEHGACLFDGRELDLVRGRADGRGAERVPRATRLL